MKRFARPFAPDIAVPHAFIAIGIALAVTLVAAHAALAAPASAPAPQFLADTTTITADGELQWQLWMSIRNPGTDSLKLDSLRCRVTNLDPGFSTVRPVDLDLGSLARMVRAVEGGEDKPIQFASPAYAEHARLRFTLVAHTARSKRIVLTQEVEALPGPYSEAFPSRFLVSGGRRVEFVLVPARNTALAAPGLLLVHGHGGNARTMLPMALLLSLRGYSVMLMSMPGYGASDGPADLMGPATMAAASAALDTLKQSPAVDARRLAVWGLSRGATVAAELGARRADLDAVIAQSGIYDLWATYRGTTLPGFREAIVAEAGRDSAAWKARSPVFEADRFQASILVLHGEADTNVPAAQAHGFVEALLAHGKSSASHFFTGGSHELPRGETTRYALEYLKQHLVE